MQKKKKILFSVLFILLSSFLIFRVIRSREGSTYVTREEPALGTFVTITIEKSNNCQAILTDAFQKINDLEMIFNIHNPASELSRLNTLKKMKVSDQLLYVFKKSIYISEITGGAFDITVLPIINLYKKRAASGIQISEQQIKQELKNIGWKKIEVNGNTVKVPCGVDMGGIAKGYIVDKTIEFLKSEGIKNGLVNAGGDIYCFGKGPGGRKWRIGIQNPFRKNSIIETLRLSNSAVVTSGDYERYLLIKNKKYGHIIDPLTGKTVQEFPAGITVIAPDTTTADGLATGFYVLGIKKSIDISDSMKDVAVLIIDGNGKIYRSKNFSNFTLP